MIYTKKRSLHNTYPNVLEQTQANAFLLCYIVKKKSKFMRKTQSKPF